MVLGDLISIILVNVLFCYEYSKIDLSIPMISFAVFTNKVISSTS